MSVPDPMSVACETRDCGSCDGTAVDQLRDQVAACTCQHHTRNAHTRTTYARKEPART